MGVWPTAGCGQLLFVSDERLLGGQVELVLSAHGRAAAGAVFDRPGILGPAPLASPFKLYITYRFLCHENSS
jgi:hypothetical protein